MSLIPVRSFDWPLCVGQLLFWRVVHLGSDCISVRSQLYFNGSTWELEYSFGHVTVFPWGRHPNFAVHCFLVLRPYFRGGAACQPGYPFANCTILLKARVSKMQAMYWIGSFALNLGECEENQATKCKCVHEKRGV